MANKIPLYQTRTFSEKFSATFDFMRQNWRVFLRLSLYLWLPLSLVQSIFLNSYYSQMFASVLTGNAQADLPWGVLACLGVVSLFSYIMIWAVTYGVMLKYEQGDGDLSQLTLRDFWPLIWRNIGRTALVLTAYLLLYAAFMVAVVLLSVLVAATQFGPMAFGIILLVIAAMVALAPPICLFPAIYLLEDDGTLWGSLRKGFRYGFKTWGGLFALLFVFGVLVYAVCSILMSPSLIMTALKSTLFPATFTGSGALPFLYTIVQDVIVIIGNFAAWLVMPLPLVAIGFHYGHAAETLDGVTVDDEIDHFEALADNDENFNALPDKE